MKTVIALIALSLTTATWAQSNTKLDSTLFVAFYHYTIQTQDENGENVTDSLRLALLVGTRATYCTTTLSYERDGRLNQELMNAFSMHHQNVLTDVEKAEVVAVEPIFPYRYITYEPLAKVDWTLSDDTLTISGLFCHRATGKLYGKQWTVWYSEDIPSSAGPWKLRGLPGLIVKAVDTEDIHSFMLYETKKQVRDIGLVDNPEYQKSSRKKLMAFKKKIFGNARYPKEPSYYVQKGAPMATFTVIDGTAYVDLSSHLLALPKSHVYQPLELE